MTAVSHLPVAHDDRHTVNVQVGDKVRGKIAEKHLTQSDIASVLGLSQQSMSKRLNGRVPFEYSELWIIARYLRLPSVSAMLAEVDTPGPDGGQSAGNATGTGHRVLGSILSRRATQRPHSLTPATQAA